MKIFPKVPDLFINQKTTRSQNYIKQNSKRRKNRKRSKPRQNQIRLSNLERTSNEFRLQKIKLNENIYTSKHGKSEIKQFVPRHELAKISDWADH